MFCCLFFLPLFFSLYFGLSIRLSYILDALFRDTPLQHQKCSSDASTLGQLEKKKIRPNQILARIPHCIYNLAKRGPSFSKERSHIWAKRNYQFVLAQGQKISSAQYQFSKKVFCETICCFPGLGIFCTFFLASVIL